MNRIKYFMQQSWLLIVASFCFGLMIAVTSAGLSPRIVQNEINKRNHLVGMLLPEARSFIALDTKLEIESLSGKKEKVDVYKAVSDANECVGWSFNAAGSGFAGQIVLVVAVDAAFEKIAGFDVLSSSETPGFGDQIKYDYYRNQFKGAPTDQLKLVSIGEPKTIDSQIVGITGATVSSTAVVDILNTFLSGIKAQLKEKGLIDDGKE